MDKYNIIIPKDNIPELDLEMIEWLQLPMDFKLRSNDDCIRLHGCTVPEYYNFIKAGLITAEDRARSAVSASNLVKEDIQWSNNDIEEGLKKTDELTQNPYIVILTPLNNHQPELDEIYNNYLNLTSKNRRLSDYYSTIIWGVNVQNMYKILLAADETFKAAVDMISKGENKSNISVIENYESIVSGFYDFINKAAVEHKSIDKLILSWDECIKYEGINESISSNILEKYGVNLEPDKFDPDKLYLPKYCPWFTLKEMKDLGYDGTIDPNISNLDYYKMVVESYNNYQEAPSTSNEKRLLELGWNPYVEPTWEAFKYAKERQYNYIFIESIYELANVEFDINDYKDEDLNYVIMKPVNKWDTDKDYVKEVCVYHKYFDK